MRPSPRVLPLFALPGLLACGGSRSAELTVDLVSPVRLVPLVFHGNCLAGYEVRAEMRVRETAGVGVVLESLEFRFHDDTAGTDLGAGILDATALERGSGEAARSLAPFGSQTFDVGGRWEGTQAGDLVTLSGRILGRDAAGESVSASYSLKSNVELVPYVPQEGGACPPS